MRSLLAIALAAGCARPAQPTFVVAGCQSPHIEPALACRGEARLVYRGCAWRCVAWIDVPEMQATETPVTVNGYVVEGAE